MDTLVFLDPDNGFETRTQRGPKWVRRWEELFADLAARLDYAPNVQAVYEASLAFLRFTKTDGTKERLSRAAGQYCESHSNIAAHLVLSRGARARPSAGDRAGRARSHKRKDSPGKGLMATCACGCGTRTASGTFTPGHDQKLRAAVEARAGGLLSLVRLIDALESFAAGKMSPEGLRAVAQASLLR